MTLKQAVRYCPYGKARLIDLVKNGAIRGGQQTDKKKEAWFFDRYSIDEYMLSMCNPTRDNIETMARESLAKVKRFR